MKLPPLVRSPKSVAVILAVLLATFGGQKAISWVADVLYNVSATLTSV